MMMIVPVREGRRSVANARLAIAIAGSALLAAFIATGTWASTGGARSAPSSEIATRFDPVLQETQVRERVEPNLCVSFRLGREWILSRQSEGISLQTPSGEDLDIQLRPATELRNLPQADLADREAAALQKSYERLIGKPAQAVDHQPTGSPGVTRWSAIWIDPNVDSASHSLKVETFIVDLRGNAALELTMNAGDSATYRTETARMLASLLVTSGSDCRDRPMAAR